jgi:hypothetical protein
LKISWIVCPSEGCLHELKQPGEHPFSDGTSVENIGNYSIAEKSITMFKMSMTPFIDREDERT